MVRLFIVGWGCFLAGCTTTTWPLRINSSVQLNVDQRNHSLPVQLVIYQLRDDQAFKQATFQQLWQNDREVLGNSLLSRQQISVTPHAHTKLTVTLKKATSYIGVVAIFRKPTGGLWRASKKIGSHWSIIRKAITVTLNKNHVTVN